VVFLARCSCVVIIAVLFELRFYAIYLKSILSRVVGFAIVTTLDLVAITGVREFCCLLDMPLVLVSSVL
jgi:hypothetical protein